MKTTGGGGMAKTSPKQRKAGARSAREADREATHEVAADRLTDDFRTEKVPGPGPNDEDAGLATTKQLETHDLKSPSR